MRPIVIDRVAWSVCRSVTVSSPAKTAEPIKMPFGLRTRVGPGNYVLDRDPDRPWEGVKLRGKRRLTLCGHPYENGLTDRDAFGLLARMGPRNHVVDPPDPTWEGVILKGVKGAARCKV